MRTPNQQALRTMGRKKMGKTHAIDPENVAPASVRMSLLLIFTCLRYSIRSASLPYKCAADAKHPCRVASALERAGGSPNGPRKRRAVERFDLIFLQV